MDKQDQLRAILDDLLAPGSATEERRAQAAERLLRAYAEQRGRFNFACDLQCELDEAVAGRPLYTEAEEA